MDVIFKIKSYGWQELAILYAPGITPPGSNAEIDLLGDEQP